MLETASRRIRSIVSLMLAAVLVLLSPGLACYSAAAAEFEGPAPKGAITPLPAVNTTLSQGLNLPGGPTTPNLNIPGTQIPGVGAELPILPAATIMPEASAVVPSVPAVTPQAEGPNVVPGTPAAEEAALTKLGQTLAPQIEAAGKTENADPRSSGERIEGLIEGGRTGGSSDLNAVDARRADVAAELPNPYGFYQHAYPIALAKAKELGKKPDQVYFYQASASVPGVNGASWKFAFYLTEKPMTEQELAKAKPATGDIVYVDFNKADFGRRGDELTVSDDPHLDAYLKIYAGPAAKQSYAEKYEAPRVSIYRNVPLQSDWTPFTADPTYFKMGSQSSAQGALDSARRDGLTGGVSVSFKMAEEPATGAKDFWYRVYDDAGKVFAANGRTTEQIRAQSLAPAQAPESAAQRLERFVANGRDAGAALGVAASLGGLWHLLSMTPDTELMLKIQIMAALAGLAAVVGVGVVTAQLGRLVGKLASGVKSEAPAVEPAPVVAAQETAPAAPVVAATEAPAAQAQPAKGANEREGAVAGDWIGGFLTVGSALVGLQFVHAATMAAPMTALLVALSWPFVGLALVVGLSAAGAAIGRGMDERAAAGLTYRPGLVAQGLAATAGTLLLSGLVAAVTGWAWPMVIASFAAVESAAGFIGLIAAAVRGRGHIDFTNDPVARKSSVAAISGVLSGATFAAMFGWLSYTIAGTMKDKPAQGGVTPLYAEAYAAATKAAAAKGYKPSEIQFAEAENQNPGDPKTGWSFYFVARKDKRSAEGELFKTYLYPQDQDGFRSNAYSYGQTKISDGTSLLSLDGSKGLSIKAGLASSLERAAKALGTPAAQLGLTMRPEGKDLSYVFENEAGARWGVNARTGKSQSLPASTVTAERIAAAVKSAVSYKGRPWSQTEYNMEQSMTENGLRRDGAGPAQIRLFYRLCGEAPVRPGGFNPWSGD
jgi:hypothetical protein